MSALEKQVGGDHYKQMAIQPTEYCQKNKFNHCESSAIKYISRHAAKGGAEDIRKAIHFLELLLEIEYAETYTGTDYCYDHNKNEVKVDAELSAVTAQYFPKCKTTECLEDAGKSGYCGECHRRKLLFNAAETFSGCSESESAEGLPTSGCIK